MDKKTLTWIILKTSKKSEKRAVFGFTSSALEIKRLCIAEMVAEIEVKEVSSRAQRNRGTIPAFISEGNNGASKHLSIIPSQFCK